MKKLFLLVVILAALALSACTGTGAIPVTGETPGAVETMVEGGSDTAALVTRLIQERLATEFNVSSADVQVNTLEPTDWSDSCLGLGGPAEICAQAITPGFRASVVVNGQTYEVRTTTNGEVIRWQ